MFYFRSAISNIYTRGTIRKEYTLISLCYATNCLLNKGIIRENFFFNLYKYQSRLNCSPIIWIILDSKYLSLIFVERLNPENSFSN